MAVFEHSPVKVKQLSTNQPFFNEATLFTDSLYLMVEFINV
jgi:hypothetical protein